MTLEIVSSTVAVVTLGGDHDVASLDAVEDAFRKAGAGRDLLVDLSGCTFIDSTIIKLLLRTMRSLEVTGGRFELVIDPTPSGHVTRVAALMGIADVIPTHETRTRRDPAACPPQTGRVRARRPRTGRSHSSLRVGNEGTACQRSSSETSATTAIVAACRASAISAP